MRAAEWTAPDQYELRHDGRRFEEWEQDYAAKIGLARAIDYALEWGVTTIWDRVHSLGERLRSDLAALEGVTIRDAGRVRCGIVTFDVRGVAAKDVKAALTRERINVTVAATEDAVIDARERALPDLVRASVHYYNSEEELDRAVSCVARVAS
jgi:selenocysteine lyase/cysteine desulfurase